MFFICVLICSVLSSLYGYINMSYKFYTTTEKARSWMMEAISMAEKSIYIEMYIFLDDTKLSHDFLWEIRNKLKKWVEVVIIIDIFWSFALSRKTVDELRMLWAEIYFFSHFLRRTHRKILIVDNKISFLWWVNVKWWSRHRYDLQVRLTWLIVKPLLKSFAYTYKMCGGKNEYLLNYSKKSFVKKIKWWIVENRWKSNNIYHLNNYYKRKILEAEKNITIVTPYFIPPRWMIALLHAAVHRGVVVEIIIPKDTDVSTINYINYYYVEKMFQLWMKFYFMPNMNHAKVMIIDNKEAVVWSQNIDFLSFDFNAEVWAFFSDKKAIEDLENIVSKRKNKSTFFIPSKRKLWLSSWIIKHILRLFFPIL